MSEREEEQVTEESADTPEAPEADDVETRARAAGWVPKEKYWGDPDEWVPAEEWLNYTPGKLRKQNKALERQIGAMKRSLDVVAKRQEEMRDQAYKDARKDIRERQKAAAKDGDMETYEALEEERAKLEEQPPEEKKTDAPEVDPVLTDWAEKNQWIVTDQVNFAEAQALDQRFMRQYPASTLEQRLEMITREMTRRYGPERENGEDRTETRTQRASMAESHTRGAGRGGGKKNNATFADLSPEEKTAVYELERRGQIGKGDDALFKSRDDYARHLREYYGED